MMRRDPTHRRGLERDRRWPADERRRFGASLRGPGRCNECGAPRGPSNCGTPRATGTVSMRHVDVVPCRGQTAPHSARHRGPRPVAPMLGWCRNEDDPSVAVRGLRSRHSPRRRSASLTAPTTRPRSTTHRWKRRDCCGASASICEGSFLRSGTRTRRVATRAVWSYRDDWLADPRLRPPRPACSPSAGTPGWTNSWCRPPRLPGPRSGRAVAAVRAFGGRGAASTARPHRRVRRPWTDVVTTTTPDERLASIWPLDRQDEPAGRSPRTRTEDPRPACSPPRAVVALLRPARTRTGRAWPRSAGCWCARTMRPNDHLRRGRRPRCRGGPGRCPPGKSVLQGCHAGLDPIAAALYGFWSANEYQTDEIDTTIPSGNACSTVLGV